MFGTFRKTMMACAIACFSIGAQAAYTPIDITPEAGSAPGCPPPVVVSAPGCPLKVAPGQDHRRINWTGGGTRKRAAIPKPWDSPTFPTPPPEELVYMHGSTGEHKRRPYKLAGQYPHHWRKW